MLQTFQVDCMLAFFVSSGLLQHGVWIVYLLVCTKGGELFSPETFGNSIIYTSRFVLWISHAQFSGMFPWKAQKCEFVLITYRLSLC